MKLSAMRTFIRKRFQDPNAGFLDSALLDEAINYALEDFHNDVEPEWREYGWYVAANQQRYDLPADYMHIRNMMFYQGGEHEVCYKSPKEFQSLGGLDKRTTGSAPDMYTIIDNDVYVYPVPSTAGTTSPLSGAHNSSVTTFTVDDASSFHSPGGLFIVNSEQIAYQNVDTTNNQLEQCIRAQGGTSAASHSDNDSAKELDLIAIMTYAHKDLSADGDEPLMHERYHKVPLHHVMFQMLRADGREQSAAVELQLYELKKDRAKRSLRLQSRDSNPSFRTSYR